MGEKGTQGYEAMKKGLLPDRSRFEPQTKLGGFLPDEPKKVDQPWRFDAPDRAYNPGTGEDAAWDDGKQQWIDTKSGQPIGRSGLTALK